MHEIPLEREVWESTRSIAHDSHLGDDISSDDYVPVSRIVLHVECMGRIDAAQYLPREHQLGSGRTVLTCSFGRRSSSALGLHYTGSSQCSSGMAHGVGQGLASKQNSSAIEDHRADHPLTWSPHHSNAEDTKVCESRNLCKKDEIGVYRDEGFGA